MSETTNEDSGGGRRSIEENSNGQRSQSEEALAEWRSSDQVENGTPSTSPPYWDIDDEDDFGSKPAELYGRNVWKIEKFSEINKRELRGDVFEVGGYKWYILIYPQGCDVCNHLSLFLCVADHEKLLPGWSHFAQFTIGVVNKDPKKSKHSDTLHRFWKKEHDWGWKKFIELPKLKDGFIDDNDSLNIKAQVQVIRERVDRPFRCLYIMYRRELVRVYLKNVEQICGRFVEEKRNKLCRLIEDKSKWKSFCAFWMGLDQISRRRMSREKMDVILKIVVKQFFIEKEVTSTLVMDSLHSGLKSLEGQIMNKKSRPRLKDTEELLAPIVSVDNDMFALVDDVLLLLERAALEQFSQKDQNRMKDGNSGEEINAERDEKRLTELGRRTVEIYVLSHIFSNKIEVAYQEAIAWKRQEELIREEEEAWLAESEQKAKRGSEKKSKKKQAKQKKNKNRGKEKKKEEKVRTQTEEKEECVRAKAESSAEKPDTVEDVSDVSDSVDSSADILQLDSEDRESSPVHWEADAAEIHPPPSGDTTRGRGSSISIPNGVAERKGLSTMDDSSSTCSNDSIRSGVANGSYKGNVVNCRSQNRLSNEKTHPGKVSDANSLASETKDQRSSHASNHMKQNHASEVRRVVEADAVISHIQEPESPGERSPVSKDRSTIQIKEKSAAVLSPSRASPWNPPSLVQAKPEKKSVTCVVDAVPKKKVVATRSPSSDQTSPSRDIQSQTAAPRADIQKIASPKPMSQPAPPMSRPSSAPIIPPKQAVPVISAVQTSTMFARSMSSTGRLGSPTHSQPYIPQSYKHAIVGSSGLNHSSSQSTVTMPPYSHPSPISVSNQSSFPINVGSWDVSSGGLLWTGGSSSNRDSTTATTINGNHRTNPYNTPAVTTSLRPTNVQIGRTTQSLMTDEFPHLDIINDLLEDEQGSMDCNVYRLPQQFTNQYTYHGGADLGISGRSRSYSDDGFHQSYGEYMPHSSSSSPYGNGQAQSQWHMSNMDLSLLAMRHQDDASAASATYSYFDVDSPNPNSSARINGYRDFRPSNGH
ncbi:TNF receptor-associated factor-like protein [Cardamine amara subsp. amara]|uniref:TNF receptor-associated factor-like protein n=1 Tax=Cardamine amara subsp. amara TaxID=228776 RepID=A0ABD0Z9F7_CARAN